MTKQKPLLFPSVPNAPAYLRRMPTKAEVPADLILVHNSVRGKPRLGSNGFRAWLARPAARYVRAIANGRRTSPFTTAWNRMGHEGQGWPLARLKHLLNFTV